MRTPVHPLSRAHMIRAGQALAAQMAWRSHARGRRRPSRSEEHTSELQSLMRISYAVFCLKKKTNPQHLFGKLTPSPASNTNKQRTQIVKSQAHKPRIKLNGHWIHLYSGDRSHTTKATYS